MATDRRPPFAVSSGTWLLLAVCLGFAPAANAQMWGGSYDPDWANHVSIGGMVGLNIKADFKRGGVFNLPVTPGVYDDGYVQPSQNANGLTSNWGYENASQLVGQTLTMHQTTAYETAGSSESFNGDPFPGFQLTYGGNFWYVGRTRVGFEFGFGWLPINITANESAPATADQSTYLFNTGGITVPPAPYHGTSAGYGPSIPSTGTSGPATNGAPGTLTGTQTLDVNLFTFRLGPSVYWDFNRHLGMSLGAGPALGYVPGRLEYNETITANGVPARNQGKISVSDVVYGWYVNTMLTYHLVRNGDIFVAAEYMPLGTASLGGGNHSAQLDLKGQVYLSAGINWPF
jgi:hypothetical protein